MEYSRYSTHIVTILVITFDLLLFTKAARVIAEKKLPIIPILGASHSLKSIQGTIGYMMKGSGLESVIKLIFPNSTDQINVHNIKLLNVIF